jgi:CIC family chloride channel protein
MAAACRSSAASSSPRRRCGRAASARRSAWRPATRNLASGIASRIGMAFRLRRADLRILVGCGAAGGIAGAFGAPLAGAFYGFELIIGGYSPNSLAPVAVAALLGYLVAHALAPAEIGVVAPDTHDRRHHDLVIAALIGLLCAVRHSHDARGSAVRSVVCSPEAAACAAHGDRRACRRAVGDRRAAGDVVGPRRAAPFRHARPFAVDRGAAFCAQDRGSIVSLGSGFRGGLFFSSLLIGALGGHLLAARSPRSGRAGISIPTPMP